ncbi:Hpt domain-containing protein [Spirulina sp. CS-785/01]|uniref:Hpt domain-containing protein n=1 Tax=Spirulina sp. CS-785/01 TaxID=3021716 RepID=UPI00232F771F|nr:Hpt domain-containing protein [Spirulina sp. CS-785/01]MDB9315102.1 Hpt domain-containing protein [Spirulina sp. CS-785/01]
MDANQQKILGYFLEEAKEHLETLANGLMDLPKVMTDPEEVNELFRAAHSIKGGSAMLGYGSIQKSAHRLEDCFKILRENEISADPKLESLFLKGYDTLSTLLEELESPYGLQDDKAEQIVKEAEPDFEALESYLNHLVGATVVGKEAEDSAAREAMEGESESESEQQESHSQEKQHAQKASKVSSQLSSEQQQLAQECKQYLKEMLQLFKGKATPASRKKLQNHCVRLAKLAPKVKNWQLLAKSCHQAIANPKFSYRTLAPVIIQELKKGSDLLILEKTDEIAVSEKLEQLAAAKTPQVLIPVDPKAAAKTLTHVFTKKQLSQLVQLLKTQ